MIGKDGVIYQEDWTGVVVGTTIMKDVVRGVAADVHLLQDVPKFSPVGHIPVPYEHAVNLYEKYEGRRFRVQLVVTVEDP
jgi:hypothetical protein